MNYKTLKSNFNKNKYIRGMYGEEELSGIPLWWYNLDYDSWQKKTVRFFKFKYRRYISDPYYDFKYGVKNLFRWFDVVWKDRNWDTESGFYNFTQRKLELARKTFVRNDFIADVDEVNRYMTIAIELIKKMRDEFYSMEHFEYEKRKFEFVPCNDGTKNSFMNTDLIWEKWDDYLKKYPSSVRAVIKKHGEIEKSRLVFFVAQHNEERANKLLFKILETKLRFWWD